MKSAHAAATPPPEPIVEVRSAGPMGDGLFATRAIKWGTTLFTESPILMLTPSPSSPPPPPPSPFLSLPSGKTKSANNANTNPQDAAMTTDPSDFCRMLRARQQGLAGEPGPDALLRRLDQLHCNPAHVSAATRARVRQWYRDHGATNARGEVLKGKKLQDATRVPVRRFGTYLTNRVPVETPVPDTDLDRASTATTTKTAGAVGTGIGSISAAVFPLYSRINHACTPNVRRAWDPRARLLTVYAVRDVAAGEQVLASYVDRYACRTRAQRARDLAQLSLSLGETGQQEAFVCTCRACTDPDIEAMRCRALVLSRGLAHYENPVARSVGAAIGASIGNGSGGSGDCVYVPRDAGEARAWAEELAELLERQGLWGPELCKILETGEFQKALDFAYKEVDLARCMVGTDSEYLGKDAQDADAWVKQLQKERFRNLRQFWERGPSRRSQ
ncbi:hypothetical protein SLS62_007500 [Diatrype stigma]|uniref:SET domain-containing protein n=1 Tax=Diatrype stigma TaxID=117547 RepID=A0AAN9UWJ2_9PEZI